MSEQLIAFRYIHDISCLSDDELSVHGYYRGYPCPHNHTIRDQEKHWCYHCAIKIQSNICGFDINYLHPYYKPRYYKLWHQINVQHPDDCWPIQLPGKLAPRRICIPSYRAAYSSQLSENVTPHKAIYQCAWGDVGSVPVTRICKDPWCGNPLHMASTFNRLYPPQTVHPFDIEFHPDKLMRISKARACNEVERLIHSAYKPTINHPLNAKDAPYYDEGG